MKLREWMNENSALVTILAVVILIGALTFLVVSNTGGRGRPKGPRQQWFYDLETKALFPAPPEAIPPIDTESGKEKGVKAMVFTCTSCASDRRIAWLEKYPKEAKKQILDMQRQREEASGKNLPPIPMGMEMMGPSMAKFVTYEKNIKWVQISTAQGREIVSSARGICEEGQKLKYCFPE